MDKEYINEFNEGDIEYEHNEFLIKQLQKELDDAAASGRQSS